MYSWLIGSSSFWTFWENTWNDFGCWNETVFSNVNYIPWRRAWQPTPVLLPGESHGQRSLVGYSPWGHKESDMTGGLSTMSINTYHHESYLNTKNRREVVTWERRALAKKGHFGIRYSGFCLLLLLLICWGISNNLWPCQCPGPQAPWFL